MLKARKWLNFPTPPLFEAPARGNPLECRDKIVRQKTKIMGLPDGDTTPPCDRQMDRQTDTLLLQIPVLA